jgi:DNA polymerase I-like protein with 3'-5' exonuclease and polymerase domains
MLVEMPTKILKNDKTAEEIKLTYTEGPGNADLYLIHTPEEWKFFYDMLLQQKLVACDTETSGFHYYNKDRVCGLSFGWQHTHFYIPLRHKWSLLGGDPPAQLDMRDIKEDLKFFFAQQSVFTLWHNKKFDAHFYLAEGIEIKTPAHDTRILWQLYDENAPGALKTVASGWRNTLGKWVSGFVGKKAGSWEKELSKWRDSEARARRREYQETLSQKARELRDTVIEYQGMKLNDVKKIVAQTLKHPYKDVGKADISYDFVPVKLMFLYAAYDTFLTYKLYEHVMSLMPWNKKLRRLYVNELKLSNVLMEAEEEGVPIDRPYLEFLSTKYGKELEEMEAALLKNLGTLKTTTKDGVEERVVNLNSPQQLSESFYNLGLPLERKTPAADKCDDCKLNNCRKHYQVDAKVLSKLEKDYPIVAELLDFRTKKKLKNTYVDSILDKLTEHNKLHCSFNQNVTTGRMSSGEPNLQNIPGRDTSIRAAFVNEGDDWVTLYADYSQVEVRLTAHYSRDPVLMDAYAKGQDVHTRSMCEMFGFDYDEAIAVLKEENKSDPKFKIFKSFRNIAKRINFGIIYGVGAPGLSEQIPRPAEYAGVSHKEWVRVCQRYIDTYLSKYLGVKRFINKVNRTVKKHGMVENYFGRVRHLPLAGIVEITGDKSLGWMAARAKRQAVNYVIQGTAADVFKFAVVRVHDLLKGRKSKIINFIHDEIQIKLHKTEMHLMPEIRRVMEDFDFAVPLVVDFEISETNWAEKRSA